MQPSNIFIRISRCVLPVLIVISAMLTSCKKFIAVDSPYTSINSENVYVSDATAISTLTSVYTNLSQTSNIVYGGLPTLSVFAGLSADELTLLTGSTNQAYIGYYTNTLNTSNSSYYNFWNSTYTNLYTLNAAIEGLTKTGSLSPAVKNQLIGEARFMRAFFYFYLVNLYGDVPLATSTDYNVNSLLTRNPEKEVYQSIIADLRAADSLLSDTYVDANLVNNSTERVRPNKWAAKALLARAYLYSGSYAAAEAQASAVINNTALYNLLPVLDNVFLANSMETIWQLQPVDVNYNTQEAQVFIIPTTGPSDSRNPVYLSNQILNAFETGDKRREYWVNSVTVLSNTYYYAYKYKVNATQAPLTEYSMVLRLAEQYLIRAEARAQQDKIQDAKTDLDIIRTRAGLAPTQASTRQALLNAIYHERQVELFSEWGHRWLDLKRTKLVDAIMSAVTPQKGGSWNTTWQWYPIPLREILQNPNMRQNQGY